MKRILLASCFSVLAFACTGDEEPQGGAGASGSSGSSGQSGQAGSISAGGAAGGSAVDGAAGTSAGGASGSPISSDASDASKEANVAESSSDARPSDAALESAGPICPPQFDGGGKFPDVLRDGIWLIGWSGGLDHFSWLKFGFLADGGRNGLLSVKNAGPNDFFFPCEGNDGLFSVDAANFEVVLQMPQSCVDSGYVDTTIRFPLCFSSGGTPKGSLLHASFVQSKAPTNIDGYMFPLDYCGVNFTSCPNPFAPDQ